MTLPMIIALAVTAFMIYLIMTEKVPFGAAPLVACVLMVLFGHLGSKDNKMYLGALIGVALHVLLWMAN